MGYKVIYDPAQSGLEASRFIGGVPVPAGPPPALPGEQRQFIRSPTLAQAAPADLPERILSLFEPPPPESFWGQYGVRGPTLTAGFEAPFRVLGRAIQPYTEAAGEIGADVGEMAHRAVVGQVPVSDFGRTVGRGVGRLAFQYGLAKGLGGIPIGATVPGEVLAPTLGVPRAFSAIAGAETTAEGGGPLEVATSMTWARVFPELIGSLKVVGSLIPPKLAYHLTRSGLPDEVVQPLLAAVRSPTFQKAVESTVGVIGSTTISELGNLPAFAYATPEQRTNMIANYLAQNVVFGLFEAPGFLSSVPSISRPKVEKAIYQAAKDAMEATPEWKAAIDEVRAAPRLGTGGLEPVKWRVGEGAVAPPVPPVTPTEGGPSAVTEGKIAPGVISEHTGAIPIVQAKGAEEPAGISPGGGLPEGRPVAEPVAPPQEAARVAEVGGLPSELKPAFEARLPVPTEEAFEARFPVGSQVSWINTAGGGEGDPSKPRMLGRVVGHLKYTNQAAVDWGDEGSKLRFFVGQDVGEHGRDIRLAPGAPTDKRFLPSTEGPAPPPKEVIPSGKAKEVQVKEEAVVTPPTQPEPVPPVTPAAAAPKKPVTSILDFDDAPMVLFPLAKIKIGSVVNFKRRANPITGEVNPITGPFRKITTGPIILWQRLNGDFEVVTGRHRLASAQRSGTKEMWVQVVREADGFNAVMAGIVDAEANIRDGNGSDYDFVKYFSGRFKSPAGYSRDEAERSGLLRPGLASDTFDVAENATPDLLGHVLDTETVSVPQAIAIIHHAGKDATLQTYGIKFAQAGNSPTAIGNLIEVSKRRIEKNIKVAPSGPVQGVLFGEADFAEIDATEAAAVKIKRRLSSERAGLLAVQRGEKIPDAEKKQRGISLKLRSKQEIKTRIAELDHLISMWDDYGLNPDLVAQAEAEAGLVVKPKPAFALAPPETVAEQKARLAAEEAAKAEAAARQAMLDQAVAPVVGRQVDTTGGLFGAPQPTLFEAPTAKPQPPAEPGTLKAIVTGPARTGPAAAFESSRRTLRGRLNRINPDLAPWFELSSVKDGPSDVNQTDVGGWYDRNTGQSHIPVETMARASDAELRGLMYHEVAMHKGLRVALGEKAHGELMGRIWATLTPEERTAIAEFDRALTTEALKAEETVAYRAGELEIKGWTQKTWDRVVTAAREFIRQFAPDLRLSDHEIRQLIRRGADALARQGDLGRLPAEREFIEPIGEPATLKSLKRARLAATAIEREQEEARVRGAPIAPDVLAVMHNAADVYGAPSLPVTHYDAIRQWIEAKTKELDTIIASQQPPPGQTRLLPLSASDRFRKLMLEATLRTSPVAYAVAELEAAERITKLLPARFATLDEVWRNRKTLGDDYVKTAVGATMESLEALRGLWGRWNYKFDSERQRNIDGWADAFAQASEAMDAKSFGLEFVDNMRDLIRTAINLEKGEGRRKALTYIDTFYKNTLTGTSGKLSLSYVWDYINREIGLGRLSNDRLRGLTVDTSDSGFQSFIDYLKGPALADAKASQGTAKPKTSAQIIGADDETLAVAAQALRLESIKNELDRAMAAAQWKTLVPGQVKDLREKLSDAIKAKDIGRALAIFEKGVSAQQAEIDRAKEAITYYNRKLLKLLARITANDEVNDVFKRELFDNPAFRDRAYAVYRFMGMAENPFSTTTSHILRIARPRPDKTKEGNAQFYVEINPVNLAGDTLKQRADLKELRQQMFDYLADRTAPDWDAARAIGMELALRELDLHLSDLWQPGVSRLMKTMWSGFLDYLRIFNVPNWVSKGVFGMLRERFDMTERGKSFIQEQLEKVRRHEAPQLELALAAAMDSHRIPRGQPEIYRIKVQNPIAATWQNANDFWRLKKGMKIGNGEVVTAEDIKYLAMSVDYYERHAATMDRAVERQWPVVRDLIDTGIVEVRRGPDGRQTIATRRAWSHEVRAKKTDPGMLPRFFGRNLSDVAKRIIDAFGLGQKGMDASWNPLRIVLAHNRDRTILGYINGVKAADWRKFKYAYRDELNELHNDGETDTIHTLDDLVDNLHRRVAANVSARNQATGGNEPIPSRDTVLENVMGDFNRIAHAVFAAAEGEPSIDPTKSFIGIVGGKDAFNTPRSHLVAPPGWYDYGTVTGPEMMAMTKHALNSIDIAHLNISQALVGQLREIEAKLNAELSAEHPITAQMQTERLRHGQALYDLVSIQRCLRQVTHHYQDIVAIANQIKTAVYEDKVNSQVMGTIGGFLVTGTVAKLQTATLNLMGGLANALMHAWMMTGKMAAAHTAKLVPRAMAQGLRHIVWLLSHEKNPAGRAVYAALRSPVAQRYTLGIANALRSQIDYYRNEMETGRSINMVATGNLWKRLEADWALALQGGRPNQAAISTAGKVRNVFRASMAAGQRTLGEAAVGSLDSMVNISNLETAREIRTVFERRARDYGQNIIGPMLKAGQTPEQIRNSLRLWDDQAILDQRYKTGIQARMIREWWQQRMGMDLDHLMTDYYLRYRAAPEAERDKVRLFDDDVVTQLAYMSAEQTNMATWGSRPTWPRTSGLASRAFWLFGWFTNNMHWMLSNFDKLSRSAWPKSAWQQLPMLTQVGISLAIAGPLLAIFYEHMRRLSSGKQGAYPILTDAQSVGEAVRIAASNAMTMFPPIGTVYNAFMGTGYRQQFDLNQQIFALNLVNDAFRMGRDIYLTGNLYRPVESFFARYTPLGMVVNRLPMNEGAVDLANARAMLVRSSIGTSLEAQYRASAGRALDYRPTPATPFIQDAVNAAAKGDQAAFDKAVARIAEMKKAEGAKNPMSEALQAVRGRNPALAVFGRKLTSDEYDRLTGRLSASDRARFDETIGNYERMTGDSLVRRERPVSVAGVSVLPKLPKMPSIKIQTPLGRRYIRPRKGRTTTFRGGLRGPTLGIRPPTLRMGLRRPFSSPSARRATRKRRITGRVAVYRGLRFPTAYRVAA